MGKKGGVTMDFLTIAEAVFLVTGSFFFLMAGVYLIEHR